MTAKAAMPRKSRIAKIRAVALIIFLSSSVAGLFYPVLTAETFGAKMEPLANPETVPTPPRRRKSTPRKTASRPAPYSEFPHRTKAHQMACSSCHKFPSENWKEVQRQDDAFPDITEYPRHESCLNCHRQQFFKGNPPRICSICHIAPSPRDNSPRFPFPNPRETFDLSSKAKNHTTDFQIFFPHDKHIEVVSRTRSEKTNFQNVFFSTGRDAKGEESCAVCHQTYQPQGDVEGEFVTKPPTDLGDAFWLKKGTFKTEPVSHAKCFECHSAETGILPAPSNCAACHKLPATWPKTDFDAKAAARMKINDLIVLTSWRNRDSSATFRHEFSSHAELECASCHNVLKMNTTDPATKKVPVTSCNLCHITATTDDGGALNYEVDERKKNPKFECVKCHLTFGKMPVPESHFKAITEAQ